MSEDRHNKFDREKLTLTEETAVSRLVSNKQLATPGSDNESMPGTLAAKDLRELASCIASAKNNQNACIWAMGAHVIKVGLAPLVIDLIRKGFI